MKLPTKQTLPSENKVMKLYAVAKFIYATGEFMEPDAIFHDLNVAKGVAERVGADSIIVYDLNTIGIRSMWVYVSEEEGWVYHAKI